MAEAYKAKEIDGCWRVAVEADNENEWHNLINMFVYGIYDRRCKKNTRYGGLSWSYDSIIYFYFLFQDDAKNFRKKINR
jgi:hypothetical protein